tara:strand:+ start:364 stop:642 length:279 start_codon:yes stop_codon:yes gene_type:complete
MHVTINKILIFATSLILVIALGTEVARAAKKPPKNVKSKFYDFSEQVIDGKINKPTVIYMNQRERVRFKRLLSLKKSFMPKLFNTHKERIFK